MIVARKRTEATAKETDSMLPSQQRETIGWIFGVAVTIAAIIGITLLLPAKYSSRTARHESIAPRQPASAK